MYNNPYFNYQQKYQPLNQNYYQPFQQMQAINNQVGLLGKVVESIDVVKATDIVLDGSVNYFPLIDGSAIVTKQLQNDGTSKMVIYKPTNESKKENVTYLTLENLEDVLNEMQDFQEIKNDIKDIKKQLKSKKSKEEE